ncbi:MAG: hypothetical protein NVS3B14_01220 [Ktedonobacteraceae bacterium]
MPKIVDEQMREATRQGIISEAAIEFARLGFDQANINTIAEQSGIGKGTIYLYFENKRELFLAMLRYIAQTQLSSIRAALAAGGSLHERLQRLFLAFAQQANEKRDYFNVYLSALYGVNRAFKTEATRLLRDYVAVIALMVLSLTESYVLSDGVLGQYEFDIARQAEAVAVLILKGIGAPST